jgi:hypothetical protein
MRVLAPQSSEDDEDVGGRGEDGREGNWRERVERGLERLGVEVAALREELQTRTGVMRWRRRGPIGWLGWVLGAVVRHVLVDVLVVVGVTAWLRLRRRWGGSRMGDGERGLERRVKRWMQRLRGLIGG